MWHLDHKPFLFLAAAQTISSIMLTFFWWWSKKTGCLSLSAHSQRYLTGRGPEHVPSLLAPKFQRLISDKVWLPPFSFYLWGGGCMLVARQEYWPTPLACRTGVPTLGEESWRNQRLVSLFGSLLVKQVPKTSHHPYLICRAVAQEFSKQRWHKNELYEKNKEFHTKTFSIVKRLKS